MCIISMTTLGTALGMSAAAISSATAASSVGVSTLGVMTGVANAALAASAIGGAVSGIVGGVSSYQQGKAQQAQYNYQAQVAQRNAKIAQANADQKRQEGIEEARQQRIKTLQAVGSQRAAMAANGIDVSSGTALDVIEDTAATGELDALTTRYNYETQALAYEQQADNYNNQSSLDLLAGQNAYKSGMINAVNTGLKGLSDSTSVASKWYGGESSNSSKRVYGTRVSGGIYGDNLTFA